MQKSIKKAREPIDHCADYPKLGYNELIRRYMKNGLSKKQAQKMVAKQLGA